jgi:FSR family fosmidomycin resistance protein-like MFS transporter
VVGLALGGIASINFSFIVVAGLAVLLAGLAIMIQVMPHNPVLLVEGKVAPLPVSEIMLILLVLAIALRSTVWVGTQMDVPRYSSAALWVALAAGMGKLVGGFGADQLGWKRWMLASMTGAFFFLVFARNWLPGQMLGAFLLQTMTPLSMAAVGKALPNSSGLAASLALGAAVIAGGLPFFILPPDWFGPFTMMIFLLASGLLYWVFIRQPQLDTMK